MKVFVLGTRGIPDIMGGVETHCQALYPRLVELGYDVTVIRRTPYINADNKKKLYKGVQLVDLFAPKTKSLEAMVHSVLGVLYARFKSPDVLHIHAIGPSLVTPLARLLGLKVVVTHHGPDYNRQKWGKAAKTLLKLGERWGVQFANQLIVISNEIKQLLAKLYGRTDVVLIHNGVVMPNKSTETSYITTLGLEPQKYLIGVGRFVEEKGFHDLCKAWEAAKLINYQLVLAGDADHETAYSKQLKQHCKELGIVLTGFIKGEELNQLYSHAKLFVMPSYHEGLPIALLEAMSYNLDVLVSNIPANLEVQLDNDDYFNIGDIEDLSKALILKSKSNSKRNFEEQILKKYNWDTIAEQTLQVYKTV